MAKEEEKKRVPSEEDAVSVRKGPDGKNTIAIDGELTQTSAGNFQKVLDDINLRVAERRQAGMGSPALAAPMASDAGVEALGAGQEGAQEKNPRPGVGSRRPGSRAREGKAGSSDTKAGSRAQDERTGRRDGARPVVQNDEARRQQEETRQRDFEKPDRSFQRPSDLPRAAQDRQSKRDQIDLMARDRNLRQARMAQRAQRMKDRIANRIKNRIQGMADRDRADIDAMSMALVFCAFSVAILADIAQIVLDCFAIGVFISPFIGFAASILVGSLWLLLGAGGFSGKMKKVGRRSIGVMIGESISISEFIPWLTIECVLNFLDLIGAFDNQAGSAVKKVIG